MNSLFYNHIEENEVNKEALRRIEKYTLENSSQQIYLLSSPLVGKYQYPHEKNAIVILSPKYKVIFLNLGEDDDFEDYYDDFIIDLNSISDKYGYMGHIGKPRKWKDDLTATEKWNKDISIEYLFEKNKLDTTLQRKGELLISLLIGSVNDIEKVGVEEPESLLDKVKKNIILFDGEQTRFIYQEFPNKKTVSIQGLSGTGKTELLLHKLKELYITEENSRIFFTCHNIALSNTLKERIPNFFNFMRVDKQIEWNSRLWVNRAWGSGKDYNSGLYSYLCSFYNIPFLRWNVFTSYSDIFNQVLVHIDKIKKEDFNYAFDYILIDERQDFPEVFFTLCEKVARKKVYIAGDIFQDIFETVKTPTLNVDIVLNRCYRTDPRTLMFAHAVGLGLFEEKKLNWFKDSYWETIGYKVKKLPNREIHLSREPIRRFEDLEVGDFPSMIIQKTTFISDVIKILKEIKSVHETVHAHDIAIILLDDKKNIYEYMDTLSNEINEKLAWNVNKGYESKSPMEDAVYITNPNNVKGLEFPFVICITGYIQNSYRYRNILYTMLTRSFIQSYLLVTSEEGLDVQEKGLDIINENRYIHTVEPTEKELENITQKLIELKKNTNISYKEFLNEVFDDMNIMDKAIRKKLEDALNRTEIERFDKEVTVKFIENNIEFYQK